MERLRDFEPSLARQAFWPQLGGMSTEPPGIKRPVRAPVHLWVVGLLLVLWNCWGLFAAVAAQADLIPAMPEEASTYFDNQPLWFMLIADLGPLAGVAGAIAILLQSRWAPALFLVQIVVVVLTNAFDIASGTSLLLTSVPARGSTVFLLVLLLAQYLYARLLLRRGHLD
jgi:hypothetical protein